MPAEKEHTGGMVKRRFREFAQGRYCARSAMQLLGLPASPVLKGTNREPVWPDGIVGSISHTGDIAAAVVAMADSVESIGLDIESADPLTDDIMAMICMPGENPGSDGGLGKLLFGIKESIYKSIFPLVQEYVDFLEMEVVLHPDGRSFAAISHTNKCPPQLISRLEGRYIRLPGIVLSICWINRPDKQSKLI